MLSVMVKTITKGENYEKGVASKLPVFHRKFIF